MSIVMVRTQDICSVFAQTTGFSHSEVTEYVRRIREKGYFVRETRSKDSPRAEPVHIAFLLLALMSGQSTRKAHEALEKLSFTYRWKRSNWDCSEEPQSVRTFIENALPSLVDENATLVCTVRDLIIAARDTPELFKGGRLNGTELYLNQRTFTGGVRVCVDYDPATQTGTDVPADFIRGEDFVQEGTRFDLTVVARVGNETFDALGHALRSQT